MRDVCGKCRAWRVVLCVMFVASVSGAFACRSCGTELMRHVSHDVLCVQCAVCGLWFRAFV